VPVAQSNWCNLGNDPQTVLWLYAAIIGPYISYAAVVWWPRVDPKTVNNQLEHIQRLACLYTTGAMRTTPTAALEIIVGLSPLIVYTRQEAMMACYQLQLNTQWSRSHCGYMRIRTDLMINASSSAMRSDRNYEVHISTRDDWNECMDWPQWWGCHYPLGCRCSVFQADIYAILQCAKLCSLQCRNNMSVAICSDSHAAQKALITPKVNCVLVAETVCTLKVLSMYNSVRLVWTPGHCGIQGNEMPDSLPRQACANKYTGLEPVLGITPPTVRSELQHWACREQWKQWREATKCRHAKQLLRQANLSLTKYALRLSRADLRTYIGLLTGHADLNRHLALIWIRTDAVFPMSGGWRNSAQSLTCADIRDLLQLSRQVLGCWNMEALVECFTCKALAAQVS